MRQKLRSLCLKFLFKLIDGFGEANEEDTDKEIQDWLSWSASHIGFIKYLEARERKLIRGLAGESLSVPPRDQAHQFAGQRFENWSLLARAKKAAAAKRKRTEDRLQKNKEK